MTDRGWRSRGYLPHFDRADLIQSVTFRLWDSLPDYVLRMMAEDADMLSDAERWERLEQRLNAGYGRCYLKEPAVAGLVESALRYFDEERYRLYAWVIMPNHVYVLIEPFKGQALGKILHSWKSYSATMANRMLGRTGKFWYREYYDRYIRNEEHFGRAVAYIHLNPVAAGLVEEPEDWAHSSAARGGDGENDVLGG